MKFFVGLISIVVLGFVLAVIYGGWEKAAKLHVDQLRPAVGEQGRVVAFKTTIYDSNLGNAKAYVVLRGSKSKQAGYLYVFHSPANLEHWETVSRKLLWDEAKGEHAPYIIPYWQLQ